MPTKPNCCDGDIGEVGWHCRVGHRRAGIIVREGVDADTLREADKITEVASARTSKVTPASNVNIAPDPAIPPRSGDRGLAVDPYIVADVNVLEADDGAVARHHDIVPDMGEAEGTEFVGGYVAGVEGFHSEASVT